MAKSSQAKARKKKAEEGDQSRKQLWGGLLTGLMLTSFVADTVGRIQQGTGGGRSNAPRERSGGTRGSERPAQTEVQETAPVRNQTALVTSGSEAPTGNLTVSAPSLVAPPRGSVAIHGGSDGRVAPSNQTGHGLSVKLTGREDIRPYPTSSLTSEPVVAPRGVYSGHADQAREILEPYHRGNSSLAHPERFTKNVRKDLATGASTARADAEHGQKPLLGPAHLERALAALDGMDEEHHEQFSSLYRQAGSIGRSKRLDRDSITTQRAALFKALGARADILTKGDADARRGAMEELGSFAGDIRGMPRDALIRQITPYDVDERTSDSGFDPTAMEWMHERPMTHSDRQTENDGLHQCLSYSCAPVSFTMARAEADPAYALKLRDDTFARQEQQRMLEAVGGMSSTRQATGDQAVLRQHVDSLATASGPDRPGHELLAYANNTVSSLSDGGQQRLSEIQGAHGGWPRTSDLDRIRADTTPYGTGSDYDTHAATLDREVAPYTGVGYELQKTDPILEPEALEQAKAQVKEARARGDKSVPNVAKLTKQIMASHYPKLVNRLSDAVTAGHVVPVNIPSHTMAVVDTAKHDKGQRFLVHDPWSGKSAWVESDDLFRDGVLAKTFGLPADKSRNANSFVFPKAKKT